MITLSVGPTVVTVCESTAKCAIYQPTETLFNLLLDTINKNNYVCEVVYSNNLQLAQKVAYYAGGTATDDEMLAKGIESEFE
jgi:DNA-directed RNA polymerase subunit L